MSLWDPIWLSIRLAAVSTVILLVIATPLAWWLARSRSRFRPLVEAITALPLVLPPTVLGFYLLVFLSPTSPLGGAWVKLTGSALTFSFTGLVIASVVYSLPFAVQPLHTAFRGIGTGLQEAAAMLGAGPFDRFKSLVIPLSRQGFISAAVLSFAHTLGEFGVVLMVGGNIPGETRVIAVEIYTAVETLDYQTAHVLSAGLLIVSLVVLCLVYGATGSFEGRKRRGN